MRRQNTNAYRHLAFDPVLDRLIDRVGRPDPFDWAERGLPSSTNFEAMALHIVGQQISIAAALTIFARITAAAGGTVTPESILALADDDLRACGLSRAKVAYLHDLAQRQADGTIDLEHMDDVDTPPLVSCWHVMSPRCASPGCREETMLVWVQLPSHGVWIKGRPAGSLVPKVRPAPAPRGLALVNRRSAVAAIIVDGSPGAGAIESGRWVSCVVPRRHSLRPTLLR